MIEIKGDYNSAKVFTDTLENSAEGQLKALMDQSFVDGSKIRIMPDVHAGKGCTIGTTMTIKDKIVPNLVGVDIGCGMLCIKLEEKRIDFPKLDSVIRQYVPSGRDRHKRIQARSNIDYLRCINHVDEKMAYESLGSLGAGNHFIEIDQSSDGDLYLVIHTGSRHLGLEVCDYYQKLGYEALKEKHLGGSYKELSDKLIADLKSQGRDKDISSEIKKLKKRYNEANLSIPYDLAYVEGQLFDDYIHDMKLTQEHASINRSAIAKMILKKAKLHEVERFETVHNYIDTDNMILRKGAVSAQKGEKLIIPMNMRDGSLICIGKGNDDWNQSAPHGAGRIMSRSEARNAVSMTEFKESMAGIYSTSVDKSTIDESPMAYKPMQSIIDNISDTVEIVDIIKPLYNFKASE